MDTPACFRKPEHVLHFIHSCSFLWQRHSSLGLYLVLPSNVETHRLQCFVEARVECIDEAKDDDSAVARIRGSCGCPTLRDRVARHRDSDHQYENENSHELT